MNENGISWDPTMNNHSSHIVEKEDDGDNIKLNQKFEVLQQEWESYMQSIPRSTVRRYSTDNSAAMAKAVDQLLDTSPRNLISSLQQKWSPPKGGHWKIRTNNLAAEEMLRERISVIESGRLKGRRLFQAVEDETEMGLRGRSSDDDHDQKVYKYGRINGINLVDQEISTEVRSVPFYDSDHEHDESGVSNELPGGCFHYCCSSSSSSSSSPSHQNVEIQAVEEEKKVHANSVERRRVANYNGGNGNINNGRISWMVFMGWFAFASIIYAVFIAPMRIFGGYGDHEHHEMFLVPT